MGWRARAAEDLEIVLVLVCVEKDSPPLNPVCNFFCMVSLCSYIELLEEKQRCSDGSICNVNMELSLITGSHLPQSHM